VVVIMEENTSPSQLTATAAPYLTSLKTACGRERFMHAATHHSHPNYMAATSGVPSPTGTISSHDNIFRQAERAGDTAKAYEESMPLPCSVGPAPYNINHDPVPWYADLRTPAAACATRDVPLEPTLADDLAQHRLPAFVWITPNDCHNMHWTSICPEPQSQAISTGDAWLAQLVPQLLASRSYQAGHTLVLITWDEGSGAATQGVDCTRADVYGQQASCRIPTLVLSPYVVPGARDTSDQNLYTLLGTVEDVLGYPRLGHAVGQPSLRPGLRF
jgi:hypothetical protein